MTYTKDEVIRMLLKLQNMCADECQKEIISSRCIRRLTDVEKERIEEFLTYTEKHILLLNIFDLLKVSDS